jgi:hypothetical protein
MFWVIFCVLFCHTFTTHHQWLTSLLCSKKAARWFFDHLARMVRQPRCVFFLDAPIRTAYNKQPWFAHLHVQNVLQHVPNVFSSPFVYIYFKHVQKKTKIIQIPVSCVWNFVWPIPTSLLNSQFLSETNSSKVQSVATTCLQAHLHPKLCDYGHITGRYQLPGGPSEILVKKMVGMLGRWMGQCYFQRWMFWCMRKYIYLYLYLYLFVHLFVYLF